MLSKISSRAPWLFTCLLLTYGLGAASADDQAGSENGAAQGATISDQMAEAAKAVVADGQRVTAKNFDFAVPDAPALAVLGLTAQDVIRPATPQALATTIADGFDAQGNFQQAIAIDIAPFRLLAGDQLTLAAYNQDPLTRYLARTQLSLATTKGVGEDDEAWRVAFGLRLNLLDFGDPYRFPSESETDHVISCLGAGFGTKDIAMRVTEVLRDTGATDKDTLIRAMEEEASQRVAARVPDCQKKHEDAFWNATSWDVGFAPAWIGRTGSLSKLDWNGLGFWTSFAYGFEDLLGSEFPGAANIARHSQLIVHARYRSDEIVADEDNPGSFFKQDKAVLGGRLRIGLDNWNLSIEGTYNDIDPVDRPSDRFFALTIGTEFRIMENTWFEISYSNDMGDTDNTDNTAVFGKFKVNLSELVD